MFYCWIQQVSLFFFSFHRESMAGGLSFQFLIWLNTEQSYMRAFYITTIQFNSIQLYSFTFMLLNAQAIPFKMAHEFIQKYMKCFAKHLVFNCSQTIFIVYHIHPSLVRINGTMWMCLCVHIMSRCWTKITLAIYSSHVKLAKNI